jgi:hypothetical protein
MRRWWSPDETERERRKRTEALPAGEGRRLYDDSSEVAMRLEEGSTVRASSSKSSFRVQTWGAGENRWLASGVLDHGAPS